MDTSSSPLPEETRAAARALIEQRATLEEWLSRLSETSHSVPAHVVDRVRGDYSERLRRVTEELGAHRGAIRQDVEALRERLAEAEARSSDATDRLEELRLRHLIGEVDDAAWDEQRPPLEEEVEQAEEARGSLGAELEQIGTLLAEVEAAGADRADAAAAAKEDPWAEGVAPVDAGVAAGAPGVEDGSVETGDGLADAYAALDEAERAAPAEDEEQGWSPIQDDSYPAAAGEGGGEDEVAGIVTAEATAGEEDSAAEAAITGTGADIGRDPEDAGDEPVADIAALVPDTAPGAFGDDEVEDGTVDSSGWLTDEDDWDADLPALGASAAPSDAAPAGEPPQPPVIMESDDAGDDSLGWLDDVVPPAKKETAEAFDDLDFLRSIAGDEDGDGDEGETTAAGESEPAEAPAAADDDLAFLSDLDQSISSGRDGPNVGGDVAKKTIDCRDCGSVNDARAWYCEVCGGELS